MQLDFSTEFFGQALEIMGFGMAGIFIVSIILYLVSLALIKVFPNTKK